jgi:xanthine dehydrogenase small subunit
MEDSLQITVNGQLKHVKDVPVHTNLLDWLRGIGLTGAKEGCAEGECGACAVLVARPDGASASRWTSVNACLPPAAAFDGHEVVTSEGLGAAGDACSQEQLHPVQRELVQRAGSQCGYCTPGFICSMAAEFYRPERAAAAENDESQDSGADHECGPNGFDLHALSGNLCRCTGYRPIKDAAYALGTPAAEDPLAQRLTRAAPAVPATVSRHESSEFRRPGSLEELLSIYADHPDAVIMAGATDLGVESNIRHTRPRLVLAMDHLSALRGLERTDQHLEIGAALPLTDLERALDGSVPLLAELLPQFASRLIRNSATLGGNLGTGSPIGDAAPVLLALEATLVLTSTQGDRTVPLSEYFTGYRQTVRTEGEIIRAVRIPLPLAPVTGFQKIAKRRFDDISSVAIGIAMDIREDEVHAARIGLGGVAATPLRAHRVEEFLRSQPWNEQNARAAAELMAEEGTPMDDHRASARYRTAMLRQSFMRFFERTRHQSEIQATHSSGGTR